VTGNIDLAREIERDIERINLIQEQRSRENIGTVPVRSSRVKSTPADRSYQTGSNQYRTGSESNQNPTMMTHQTQRDFTRSNPNLNDAQIIQISDLSDSSTGNETGNPIRQNGNYYTIQTPTAKPKLIEVRIPLEEKLDFLSGINLVGGSGRLNHTRLD